MPGTVNPICVLDDDFSVLNSLRELLDSDGLQVQTFDDPELFLTYAREHPVKLAVLDVWLPQMTGIDVQERLREVSPETLVVMITGREESSIRVAAMEAGAFGFLAKPFDDEVFLGLVRSALGEVP